MSPIPTKGFFDQEAPVAKKPDSITHHEERLAKLHAESAARIATNEAAQSKRHTEEVMQQQQAREVEAQRLEQIASGIVREGETREMLLQRIRMLREIKPAEIEYPPLSPLQQEQLDREQAAGRAAVARAEEEHARYRELWHKEEEEERKKNTATTTPVYRPNEMEPKAIPKKGGGGYDGGQSR
jgi:hypothetical protein